MSYDQSKASEASYRYMDLMHRAYKSPSTRNPGAHHAVFENMISAEHNQSHVRHLPPFDEQFDKIQQYLNLAFDRFFDMPKLSPNRAELAALRFRIKEASDSDTLIGIINRAIELTQAVRSYT